ncbi:MAG: two-component regulator propeller domain-containing protein [Flavobacteriaceae bacterium]
MFHTFSPQGGLYYDGVSEIKQDKDGFMWILMENDLFRFDGYKYKRYRNYFNQEGDQNKKNFRFVDVNSKGELFVVTTEGLYLYNNITDTFSKVLQGDISFFNIAPDDTLLLSESNRFGTYDSKNSVFTEFSYKGKPLTTVHSVISDKENLFILSWGRNIFRYNNQTKETKLLYAFKKDGAIKGFCMVNNVLWLLHSNNTFHKIEASTGNIIEYVNFLPANQALFSKKILADKNDNIWVCSQMGLYVFNTKNSTYQHYLHDKNDSFSLPNNSVWTVEEDAYKNLWIGTFSGGVSYVNLDRKTYFETQTPLNSKLNHNLVSGFAEDDTSLWIATEGGGLNQIDKKTNAYNYYRNNFNQNSISSDNVKSIIVDNDHNLWFATFRGGLGHYNTKDKHFTNVLHNAKDANSILVNDLRKLIPDSNNGFWIVYQTSQLKISYYAFKSKQFTHYTIDQNNNGHYIFDACLGNNDVIWVLSYSKLYALNTKSGHIKTIALPDKTMLLGQTLCMDKQGYLWIGTESRGLVRYNTATGDFKFFDELLKFNVLNIYSMAMDFNQNLWLGTDNGLFKYNVSANAFLRFDKKDGVQGQVFYPLATYTDKAGQLYFGGTNGFTVVKNSSINPNQVKPKAIISNFFIDNTTANPPVATDSLFTETATFPKALKLNYKQANFGFTFTSDNYLVPEKNRFKYRLKHYDNRWIEVDAMNRNVYYSKIPSGTYTFEVSAANNDGLWGQPLQVTIKRLPAPWFSWWAFTIYALILAGILYTIIKYYYDQKKLKMKLYLEHLDQEKKEEIHQSQLKFFTYISHDFRTPLSLISASVEKLRQEGLKEYYYRILNGNTKRLLGLVNELMDFRTVESGKMPFQVAKTNINSFIETLAFSFKDYALQYNITFNINTNTKPPQEFYADTHILEKIVVNLLDNAFKNTNEGGTISISVFNTKNQFKPRYQNSLSIGETNLKAEQFAIAISDSGVGISKDALPLIFESYYKADTENFSHNFGSGIGLSLVKSLVLLHKGNITVYSEPHQGTDFMVCLPAEASVYSESDFMKAENAKQYNYITPQEKLIEPKQEDDNDDFVEDDYVLGKRKILLVEDNTDLRSMLAEFLSTDFEIIEAENGVIATQMLNKHRIDLIISDIMMPEKDGITLCREVKDAIDTSHIPFVMLTAKVGIDSKIEGAGSGADIYFEKPINFELLRLSIRNVFKQQQQMREYYSKNFFAEVHELTSSQRENDFLQEFIAILDKNLDNSKMDVNQIAMQLSMSRSKLYNKIKSVTGRSIIEFITSYRLRKAAHLIIEKDMSMREIVTCVGFESQSYFTRAFKKEFGNTPTDFALKNKKN